MSRRGDVVLIDFPFADGGGSKIRPAVVVQNDRDNSRLQNTVLAMITGNLSHVGEPTQVLVDPGSTSGQGSGLHGPSSVKCSVLVTARQDSIIRTLGALPPATMNSVNAALRAALGL